MYMLIIFKNLYLRNIKHFIKMWQPYHRSFYFFFFYI
uniref:Uncharacterized protein n=1 Tax=Anguilla anguilla TaxID=7936 RepID=A0A0E9XD53_ANGAN